MSPRKWSQLFDFRAAFVDTPRPGAKLPPVRVTLPEGTVVSSEQGDVNQILPRALKREVTLDPSERGHRTPKAEEYWPDVEGLDYRDTVTDFNLPEGTFFDCAVIHLLTTATVDRLRELYPERRFEVRRFRPNVVIETASGVKHHRPLPPLRDDDATPRRPGEKSGILRTEAQYNHANVGLYACVVRGGTVRRGGASRLE